MTARLTSRAGAKAGPSDPVVECGIAIAQRIKATPGITGLSDPRVHIDDPVWHLDVGSSHPPAEVGGKGLAVRQLKRYVSWVQYVVRQLMRSAVYKLGRMRGHPVAVLARGQSAGNRRDVADAFETTF